ncbi:MAG TPA: hypothetical protein VF681_02855 [Abditibacteriaceae bacterium]
MADGRCSDYTEREFIHFNESITSEETFQARCSSEACDTRRIKKQTQIIFDATGCSNGSVGGEEIIGGR